MKHYKTVVVPAAPERTEQKLDKITCDLCRDIMLGDKYIVEEVEIRHRRGEQYPESGSGDETNVDICGKCFDKKLIPWLKSQGVEPRTEVWEW